MLVISNNLSFMNAKFVKAAKSGDMPAMAAMATGLKEAGADMINISLSLDGDGDEKLMRQAVQAVQEAGLPLSIDSRNPAAMKAAIEAATVPVTLNYISAEDKMADRMGEIAKLAATKKTDLVLYAIKKGTPADADERLSIISGLMEAAGNAGVPDERMIIDPVILHLGGGGSGQAAAVAVQETLYGIREMVEPPVRTTCWISNVSAGAPHELRPAINDTFLAMLAGIGLYSAYLDVFDRETMRTVRLIRSLRNESVFSLTDARV
ncbi:MAG TPA: dihydropteroate synthase [Nitrospirota bacterium]